MKEFVTDLIKFLSALKASIRKRLWVEFEDIDLEICVFYEFYRNLLY